MKICTKCNNNKDINEFHKDKSYKDGFRRTCKPCIAIRTAEYMKTKEGLLTKIFSTQRGSSRDRGHNLPAYTKQEFTQWCLNQDKFHTLYNDWTESGYLTKLVPSVDRKDDNEGYSFTNIQLMTWEENNIKGYLTRKRRRNT